MSNPTSAPDPELDQDSEPSLNAPAEGRPDGTEPSDDTTDIATEENTS